MPDQVSTNAPTPANGDTNMPNAPVTSMNVGGQIQPGSNPPAAPSAGQADLNTRPGVQGPQPQGPQAPAGAPAAGSQPSAPHPMAKVYNGLLKTLSGGPIVVTNPDGTRREVPQTRGQLGKSILAGALAGLFAPTQMTETPYGPRVDAMGTMGSGYKAGQAQQQERQDKYQKLSDDQQARKLQNFKNASDMVKLGMANSVLDHAAMDQQNADAAILNTPFEKYDAARTDQNDPLQPKPFLKREMSSDELLASGHKWGDVNVVRDQSKMVWDDSKQKMVAHPTYALLNPAMQDIALSPEVTAKLSETNSSYTDLNKRVGGDPRISVSRYVAAMNEYALVKQGEHMMSMLAKELNGGKEQDINLSPMVKANRVKMLDSLSQLQAAVAGGNTAGARPDNLLDVLLKSPGGEQMLGLLGLTPQQASDKRDDIDRERTRKNKLAEMGGMGKNAPAAQDKIDATSALIDQIDDPKIRESFSTRVRDLMNNGELDTLDEKVRDQLNKDKEQAMKQGDPDTLKKVATLAIGSGDLTQAKDLFSTSKFSPMAKVNYDLASAQMATDMGLNPTHYTSESMKEKALKDEGYKDTTKPTSVGSQLNSFNTFLYHNADAIEASNAWSRTNVEAFNTPLNQLEKKFGNDPTYIKFKASLVAPSKEFMSFLKSGRAEQKEDIDAMNDILSVNSSPKRILAALTQLAQTADDRAASLGDSYVSVVGTTFPHLISSPAAAAMKNMGIKSRSVGFNGELPRNPAFAAQPSVANMKTLTKNNPQDVALFKRFGAATGGDFTRAVEIAREHGFIIQQ